MRAKKILLVEDNPFLSEANRLGVAAYIVKPVELDNFMKVVGDVGLRWVVKESA